MKICISRTFHYNALYFFVFDKLSYDKTLLASRISVTPYFVFLSHQYKRELEFAQSEAKSKESQHQITVSTFEKKLANLRNANREKDEELCRVCVILLRNLSDDVFLQLRLSQLKETNVTIKPFSGAKKNKKTIRPNAQSFLSC